MKRLIVPAVAAAAAIAVNVPLSCALKQGDENADALRETRAALKETRAALKEARVTITYVCSTISVLDDLVIAARQQIVKNFENGTYDKLVEKGIVSEENVEAAKTTMVKYAAAHQRLQANGACRTR